MSKEKKDYSHMKNNQFNKKANPKTSVIQIRVTDDEKTALQNAAENAEKSLSAFILWLADIEINRNKKAAK